MPPRRRAVYPPSPPPKVDVLPVEMLTLIFMFAIQANPRSQRDLMLVCCRWHDIMLSTPGNRAKLWIGRSTRKKEVEAIIYGNRSLLDVTVDMSLREYGQRSDARTFRACFMVAAQAASRWRSFELISPPPRGLYEDLQILQPLQHFVSFSLHEGCGLGNFLESLMATMTATATHNLDSIWISDPDAVCHLGRPARMHVFHTVTVLSIRLSKRMDSPADILPYLERLEIFKADHLCLPIYPPDVHLPLTQTLRCLHLKRVSIQWMSHRGFINLKECFITFPHHADTIRSVNMPSCHTLTYVSNTPGALRHLNIPLLAELEVECSQWSSWRGNLQLMALSSIFATAQSLTALSLNVQCSERMLLYMLKLAPVLERLDLRLSFPNTLSKAFFQAFVANRPNIAGATTGLSRQPIRPLFDQLKGLHIHCKRWLRGCEETGIIQLLGDIAASAPAFSLSLSFGEGPKGQIWHFYRPRALRRVVQDEIRIGFPGLHGLIFLSADLDHNNFTSPLFRESEYLSVSGHPSGELMIDLLFPFHNLRVLQLLDLTLTMQPNTELPYNLPLFHTLEILGVGSIPSSVLAGQTFHNLEGYWEYEPRDIGSQGLLTDMPACTKVDLDLSRLATFKLPQISELGIWFDHLEPNMIWEDHVAVNVNLSGLRLMHVHGWNSPSKLDLIQILRSLPALETLIIVWKPLNTLGVDFFRAFVPMDTQGITGLNKDHLPAVLCPKLESLQIEDVDLTKQPKLLPVLKKIVTLHAVVGSPLKSFTFMDSGRKWEMIGRDRRFTMEEVIPAQIFDLHI